jgi:PleD family two-component response regulator
MGIAGKILIVDDEEDALENCRRILSRVPYACVSTRWRCLSVNILALC